MGHLHATVFLAEVSVMNLIAGPRWRLTSICCLIDSLDGTVRESQNVLPPNSPEEDRLPPKSSSICTSAVTDPDMEGIIQVEVGAPSAYDGSRCARVVQASWIRAFSRVRASREST